VLSQSLAVAAGLSWAASIIVAKRLRARHQVDLLSLTAWQLVLGTIPLLGLAWLFGEPAIHWTPELGTILVFSGVFSTAVGWLMWLFLLSRLSAGTVSLNSLIIPVLAVLFAWLQFGERPNGIETAGMLVIATALGLMSAVTAHNARRVEAMLGQK
jgi:drug/metabolite transporter (DMT)-like permease